MNAHIPFLIAMLIGTIVFGLFGFLGTKRRKKNKGFYNTMKLVFFVSLAFMIVHAFNLF